MKEFGRDKLMVNLVRFYRILKSGPAKHQICTAIHDHGIKKYPSYQKSQGIEYDGHADISSVESYYEESQEYLIGEIIGCENNIFDLEAQKTQHKQLMNSSIRDVNNGLEDGNTGRTCRKSFS